MLISDDYRRKHLLMLSSQMQASQRKFLPANTAQVGHSPHPYNLHFHKNHAFIVALKMIENLLNPQNN